MRSDRLRAMHSHPDFRGLPNATHGIRFFHRIGLYVGSDLLSIVLELPPAPAALVLLGRWLAVFSARSAAAFLRMTVAGPPGGLGETWRAVDEPEGVLTGEVGRGADCNGWISTDERLRSW